MNYTQTRRPMVYIGSMLAMIGFWLLACTPVLAPNEPNAMPAQDQTRSLLPTVTPISGITSSTFQPDQVQLALRTVVEGLDRPLFVTHTGDGSGRLFIVEKAGTIRIFQQGQLLATPFLDLTDRVNAGASERGLLGLAFAPGYAQSGYFFVNYTDSAGDTNIVRFQVSPAANQADVASAFTVLKVAQPAANHNGGMLAFGSDGYLYIGMGDGGGGGSANAQAPDTLLGKMLRIDVMSDPSAPYSIPADNPWVDQDWNGADMPDEVWGLGLRNPWRYSFDRQTGDLWIADVGAGQYEEVNFVPATHPGGLNFGWPLLEGTDCSQSAGCPAEDFMLPVTEYTHEGHCSITGGYVYRGAQFPALNGVYFFGDYCSGVIWATWPTADGQWSTAQVLESELSLSSFGEDEAGELLVTDLSGGTVSQLIVDE